MKKHFFPIYLLLAISVCPAAEIVGWKVPLSRFVGRGLEADGIVRIKSAPEASPFFKEGDELWDLKEARLDTRDDPKLSLDWLIWDATSERLVAKGSWTDLCAIHEILRADALPRHLKLTVAICEVVADAAPLAENAKPVSKLSICVRSGQNATANWGGNGSSLEVDAGVEFVETDPFVDVRLLVTAKEPDQLGLRVNTAFTLKSGCPLWVARDFDGKQGLDLQASGTLESMDGTPLREVMMIQKGNATQSLWPQQRSHEYERVPVEGGGWLMSCFMSPGQLEEIIKGSRQSSEADPFAEPSEQERPKLPRAASVKPPALISSSLDHEVLDATEWLRKGVLNLAGNLELRGSFVGYDPIGQRFYFYSSNQTAVEMVSQLLTPMCNHRPALLGVTLDGVGQTRLIGKSGQKASLERITGKETVERSFEIEPTIGENDDVMDLRFVFEDRTDAKKITEINSSNTLSVGKPLEVFSDMGADRETRSLRLMGEVLRISPVDGE